MWLIQIRPQQADDPVATLKQRRRRHRQEGEKRERFGLREYRVSHAWRPAKLEPPEQK